MNKAIFLDRDGTINIDKGYVYKPDDFEFLPGAIEGMRILQKSGYLLIIITNQSGIGRKFYTENDFDVLNQFMLSELEAEDVKISGIYHCPHVPSENCLCRKPLTGMFEQAIRDFDIDINASFSIGDKLRDLGICEKTECRGFLIGKTEHEEIIDDVIAGKYKRVKYAESLLEAAKIITSPEPHVTKYGR